MLHTCYSRQEHILGATENMALGPSGLHCATSPIIHGSGLCCHEGDGAIVCLRQAAWKMPVTSQVRGGQQPFPTQSQLFWYTPALWVKLRHDHEMLQKVQMTQTYLPS